MQPARWRRAWPAVAAVWAGVAVAASLGALVLHALGATHDPAVNVFSYSDVVVGLAFAPIGAFIARRRPGSPSALVLCSAGLVGVGAFAREWAYHGGVADPGSLPLVPLAAWVTMWSWFPYLLQPSWLPLLLPGDRLPEGRWRRVLHVEAVLFGASVLAAALRPGPVDGIESTLLVNPLGAGSAVEPFIAVQSVCSGVGMLIGMSAALLAVTLRYRRVGGRERSQLQWLLFGVTTCALLLAGLQWLPLTMSVSLRDALFGLALLALPVSIAIAILRHELFDIRVVVDRVLVYGVLSALGLGLYAAVVALAGLFADRGVVTPPAAAVAALFAAGARARVRRAVDRRLFGLRREPFAAVQAVSTGLEAGAGAADEAIDALTTALRAAFRLPFAAFVPADPGEAARGSGTPVAAIEEFPVAAEGQTFGMLHLGHRHRGGRFTEQERAVLADAARRLGGLLHARALTRDLLSGHERLIAARGEERRRLLAELHDGLGPTLAGMALQVDSLARRVQADPELAERAAALRDRLQGAVTEVRRIIEGMRPALVDEVGLLEAVRQLETLDGGSGLVRVHLPDALPVLASAVEHAVYRIASEATTNTLRHGSARRCDVRLAVRVPWLEVEVRDDGRGFAAEQPWGVGLHSMSRRSTEIGGTFAVDSAPGEGTVVTARLPMEPGR